MTTVYKFKKSILFVVLYMMICDMTESTLPEYDCDGNGTIFLKNTDDIHKIEIVKDHGVLCPATTKYLSDNCALTVKSPITILYGDHLRLGNDMMGGHGSQYVTLSCKGKKALVTASVNNAISIPTKIPVQKIEKKYVIKLSIEGLSHSNEVKLGQSFTLVLEGPDIKHSLRPRECKAYPTGQHTNEHVIWNSTISATGKCFNEASVINQTWTTVVPHDDNDNTEKKKTKLSIGMYTFRFAASPSVTIKCSAYVCPSDDNSPECKKKCIDGTGRRRRAIQTSPKSNNTRKAIMVASTSFQVQLGDQNTGNSAERLSKNVQLYSVTSIFVLMVTMMIR